MSGFSRLSSNITNSCWDSLLKLAQCVKQFEETVQFCSISFGTSGSVQINSFPQSNADNHDVLFLLNSDFIDIPEGYACYRLQGLSSIVEVVPGPLSQPIRRFLTTYAPYCFLSLLARRWQRCVTVSHSAQSLDGRIATESGDSKWIGNKSNLEHAHRMRALCDGVLIGRGTLNRDKPQLTVRHVKGPNPVRIVLGSNINNIDSLLGASTEQILILGSHSLNQNHQIRVMSFERTDGHIATSTILKRLYEEGIFSVYVEGGAETSSHFLQENTVDVLQLHVAPRILGSGINTFSLPPIHSVGEAIRFVRHTLVTSGDGIMFIGDVDHSRSKGIDA
ncbi:MAG: RibD family protein [Fidelibacterota bacterium]